MQQAVNLPHSNSRVGIHQVYIFQCMYNVYIPHMLCTLTWNEVREPVFSSRPKACDACTSDDCCFGLDKAIQFWIEAGGSTIWPTVTALPSVSVWAKLHRELLAACVADVLILEQHDSDQNGAGVAGPLLKNPWYLVTLHHCPGTNFYCRDTKYSWTDGWKSNWCVIVLRCFHKAVTNCLGKVSFFMGMASIPTRAHCMNYCFAG